MTRNQLGLLAHVLALAAALLVLGACQRNLSPTPNLYVAAAAAGEDVYADVHPDLRTASVDVLYVTDRAPRQRDGQPLVYGYGRSPSLAWGSAKVQFGNDLNWDELSSLSQSDRRSKAVPVRLRDTEEQGRFPDVPMPMVMKGEQIVVAQSALDELAEAEAAFCAEIQARLERSSLKTVTVLLHGVANSFEDAIKRAGEWQHYMRGRGVFIAYTWPAGHPGLLEGYIYDHASSRFTVFHLKQLLRALASCPEVERINLAAHSRGTQTVTTAIRELGLEARGAEDLRALKIGHVVLLASDIDWEIAGQRDGGDHVYDVLDSLTVYVSSKDQALNASNLVWKSARRAGQVRYEDLTHAQRQLLHMATNMNVIDVQAETGGLGHSYSSNPAVASDLILLLVEDRPPGAEHGRPLRQIQPGYWALEEGYPAERSAAP